MGSGLVSANSAVINGFKDNKFFVARNSAAISKKSLQRNMIIQMSVTDDSYSAAIAKDAFTLGKHFKGNFITYGIVLMKGWVAQYKLYGFTIGLI